MLLKAEGWAVTPQEGLQAAPDAAQGRGQPFPMPLGMAGLLAQGAQELQPHGCTKQHLEIPAAGRNLLFSQDSGTAHCLDPLLALPTPWSRATPEEHPRGPAPMVSPLQVDHAKVLHYIGAGVAFPTSMLFLLLQSILTYRMAKTPGQYWTGHLRSILTAVAFLTLVFSILLKGVGRRSGMGSLRGVCAPHPPAFGLAARHGARRGWAGG